MKKKLKYTYDDNSLIETHYQKWIKQLDYEIDQRLHLPDLKINNIAEVLYISERTLRSRIQEYCKTSPSKYLLKARMKRAQELIRKARGKINAKEICKKTGLKAIPQSINEQIQT